MDDEISISVSVPLDQDGFLRRECPTCEQQFKWYAHNDGDSDAEIVSQYFCPLCGEPSGVDTWWTPAQLEFAQREAGPALDEHVHDLIADAFKGIKGIDFKPNRNFSLDIPPSDPLAEPDDMVIVEPPCHPNEPVKVPDTATERVYCLVCGTPFAT
jgi:endogenous inhibitor of DNA gyrase (YacG/DUF329 family)